MHEMGIASSILEAAETEALRCPGHRPSKVGVVVGEFAGVDTESLRFCFEVLSKGHVPAIELEIGWHAGSDELKLEYLEMEEVSDEQSGSTKEGPKRKRPNRSAAS